ncbi:MAG TPA: hypothetical protein VFD43_04295, partial [Planctomycetota bacterium]|nr:hypothetical protein [Planctomycetota bacterium]
QPDADAVWDYLKSFRFRPTEGFAALGLEASAAGAVLKGAGAPESRAVLIEISHGGRASTRELRLVRAPRDEQGGEWMLDAEEVAGLFNQRMIRRSDVPRLEDPDRSR